MEEVYYPHPTSPKRGGVVDEHPKRGGLCRRSNKVNLQMRLHQSAYLEMGSGIRID